ncbi:MAG: hypothetical protein AAFP04_15200 [Myxococcota bacterium]
METESISEPAATAGRQSHHIRLRSGAIIAGVSLLIGYVLPWVQIGEMARVSGLELTISDNIVIRNALGSFQRRLILVVPLLGALLLVMGIRDMRWLRWATLGSSLTLLLLGIVVLLNLFLQVTSIGLWLILIGLLVSFVIGMLVKGE